MTARDEILKSFAEWTALSALRSGSPIKSRKDVYGAIQSIVFDPVLDTSKGALARNEFDEWHRNTLVSLTGANAKLANQFGWAAKIVNVYLKTYCYVGDGGRAGIREYLHPPIDAGLWKGVKRRFQSNRSVLDDTHVVTTIARITSHDVYLQLVKGFREAATQLKCPLIEIEQLWEKS